MTPRRLLVALGAVAGGLFGALFGLNEVRLGTTLVQSADPGGVLRDAAIGALAGLAAAAIAAPFLKGEVLEKGVRAVIVLVVALAIGVVAALAGA